MELSPHLFKRMEDRDFNEVELRTMLEHASTYRPDVIDGRWIVVTRHRQQPWEVIVEPDPELAVLICVTAYPVWKV